MSVSLSGTSGSAGGMSWVVPGQEPTVTATLPSGATGTVNFEDAFGNEWNNVAVVNGQASVVVNTAGDPVGADGFTATYDSTSDLYSDAGGQSAPLDILGPNTLGGAGMTWTFAKDGATSTQLLEDNGAATNNGATTDTWAQAASGGTVAANEAWVYQPSTANPGYGELVNQSSGLCLERNGTSGAVDQWACSANSTNQLWQEVTNTSTNEDFLKNLYSGQYLATTSADGAPASSGNGNALALQSAQNAYSAWTATPGTAPTLAPGGQAWTFALNGASGGPQLLEDNGASTAPGATVDTWAEANNGPDGSVAANEVWTYEPNPAYPGYGQLLNESSQLCLERNGTSGVVDQWGCGANSPNQLWALVANPSGGYSLQELYTGQYLGATTAGGGNGTKLSLQATQSANTAWTATSQG
jgi:hypothetical protein